MRNCVVDLDPWQFIFQPDHFLRSKSTGIIERGNRHVDDLGIVSLFEKEMRAAARGKGTNPAGVWNFARLALGHTQISAIDGTPGDKRRTGAAATIEAMAITE